MRQYRGKTKKGKWVYGGLYELANGMTFIVTSNPLPPSSWTIYIGNFFASFIEVIGKTVGQSTGLCDKNGKEIHEEDIVKRPDGSVGMVVYSYCTFFIAKTRNIAGEFEGWLPKAFDKCEIIGTIHDNPELLK